MGYVLSVSWLLPFYYSLLLQAGIYLFSALDSGVCALSILVFALLECIGLAWLYGFPSLQKDLWAMTGKRPGTWWALMWKYITPAVLMVSAYNQLKYPTEYYKVLIIVLVFPNRKPWNHMSPIAKKYKYN